MIVLWVGFDDGCVWADDTCLSPARRDSGGTCRLSVSVLTDGVDTDPPLQSLPSLPLSSSVTLIVSAPPVDDVDAVVAGGPGVGDRWVLPPPRLLRLLPRAASRNRCCNEDDCDADEGELLRLVLL